MMDSNAVPFTFQAGGGQLSFGGGDQELPACTWEAPVPSPDEDEGNDRKRRRVQVDMDKLGVSVLKLGSDMTFDFRSAHAEAEKKLADITSERDELEKEHDLSQAEKHELMVKLVSVRKHLSDAKKQNRKLETHLSRQKATATAKAEESEELESSLEMVKNKWKNARGKNKAKVEECNNLKEDINRLKNDIAELQANNEAKVEECRNLQNGLLTAGQLNDRFSELETENKELGLKRDSLMAEKLQLKEDYNKLEGENDKLKEDYNKLKGETGKLKIKNGQLKTENEELKREKQELEQDNNVLADTCYGGPKTLRTPRKKATPKKSQPSPSPSVTELGSSVTVAGSMNESLNWVKDETDSV